MKKTAITLRTEEPDKKLKRDISLQDARGRSPHGALYLLDKNFRSYNSISQKRAQRQSANLLDRLCQSYVKGDRPRAQGQTDSKLPNETNLNRLRSPPRPDQAPPQLEDQPPHADSQLTSTKAEREAHYAAEVQAAVSNDDGEEEYFPQAPRLPDIAEASRETPSIRHQVPSPIEKTERADRSASGASIQQFKRE